MTEKRLVAFRRKSFMYDVIDFLLETYPFSFVFAGPIVIIVGSLLVTAGIKTIVGK